MNHSIDCSTAVDWRRTLLLLGGALWCVFLLAGRIVHTRNVLFAFLVWNLFLAFIPLLTARALTSRRPGLVAWMGLGVWLLFFPNAPYVVTDLLHLQARPGVPQWFDLLLLLSFASVALWAGLDSLRLVQRWLEAHFSPRVGWLAALVFLFLGSFGVSLGRFQRWNSWDLLHQPTALLRDVAMQLLDPIAHPRTWGFTIGFGFLLGTLYLLTAPAASVEAQRTR